MPFEMKSGSEWPLQTVNDTGYHLATNVANQWPLMATLDASYTIFHMK